MPGDRLGAGDIVVTKTVYKLVGKLGLNRHQSKYIFIICGMNGIPRCYKQVWQGVSFQWVIRARPFQGNGIYLRPKE